MAQQLFDILRGLMASPSAEKLPRTQLDNQLSYKRLDTASLICSEFFKWGSFAFIAYMGYLSIGKLAGQNTYADIAVRAIGNVKVSDGIITLLIVSGWAFGLAQRSLRRRYIERTAPVKNKLERILDAKRTSSNLTSRGTTPPEKGKR
jgi:hypothetical protein